jgi:uncharacterized membrane protein
MADVKFPSSPSLALAENCIFAPRVKVELFAGAVISNAGSLFGPGVVTLAIGE